MTRPSSDELMSTRLANLERRVERERAEHQAITAAIAALKLKHGCHIPGAALDAVAPPYRSTKPGRRRSP